jgi:LysM repeat protein
MDFITQYEKKFDDAIAQIVNLIFKFKNEIKTLDDFAIDFNPTNYDDLIYQLEGTLFSLKQKKVQYRFDRMSREEFAKVLQNVSEGKPPKLITLTIDYKVTAFDTLQSISLKYGVTVQSILDYNKTNDVDFETAKELNSTIKIPQQVDLKEKSIYDGLLVFGSQSGRNAWGTDWANGIVFENGDIKVLDNEQTLKQGLLNRYGDYGDIPGYEDQTIELPIGSDYPPDLVSNMLAVGVDVQFRRDPRVKDVLDVVVSDNSFEGKSVSVKILPINEEVPIDISI